MKIDRSKDDADRFANMPEGQQFHFKQEVVFPDCRQKRGPWTKGADDSYTREGDEQVYHIGDTLIEVVKLEDCDADYSRATNYKGN